MGKRFVSERYREFERGTSGVPQYLREADWSTDLVAEDGGCCVSLIGVDQHSWNDSMSVECLSVCKMGV